MVLQKWLKTEAKTKENCDTAAFLVTTYSVLDVYAKQYVDNDQAKNGRTASYI